MPAVPSDPIGPVDIDLQGKQPELTDTQMLDWLIEAVNSTRLGAFIKDRSALRALMEADRG